MFLRIEKERFDTTPDTIVAAASHEAVGAVVIYNPSVEHLKVIYLSGSQLSRLDEKLRHFIAQDPQLGSRDEVVELMEELYKCSNVFIVSTTKELLIVSDRSRDEYEQIESEYQALSLDYDQFRESSSDFVRYLSRLPG